MQRMCCSFVSLCAVLFVFTTSHAVAAVPSGKGDWINYPSDAIININANGGGGGIATLAQLGQYLYNVDKDNWVAIKCSGGDTQSVEFNANLVSELKRGAPQLQVFGWAKITHNSAPDVQGTLARSIALSTGLDGLIITPAGYTNPATPQFYDFGVNGGAIPYWNALNNGGKPCTIGYCAEASTVGPANGVHNFFIAQSDFLVPRFFWTRADYLVAGHPKFSAVKGSQRANWIGTNKPIISLGQCQRGTGGQATMFTMMWNELLSQRPLPHRMKGYSMWLLDYFVANDFTEWQKIPRVFP